MHARRRLMIMSLAALLAAVIFVFIYWSTQNRNIEQKRLSGEGLVVVLNSKGFTPAELVISLGAAVTFQNNSGKTFWPASDMHPTHDIYSEFDPKKPIEPGQNWTFQFNKSGTWKYHDHLNPTRTGSIIVQDAAGDVEKISCNDSANNSTCWQHEINQILENQGLDAAFERLAQLYSSEQGFAVVCHAFAHELGKAAYRQFSENGKVELSDKAQYCGYGFYHGFMETLLYTSGNVNQAQEFCAYVGRELHEKTVDAEDACFHGIGHGAVDGSDENAWGNPAAMLEPGMKMCTQVAGDFREPYGKMYRCMTGGFNALEILSSDTKYKLTDMAKDPFKFCTTQPQEFLEGCYTNMLPAILRITKNNYQSAAKMVSNIKADTEKVRGQVILSLFHEFIRDNLLKPDYSTSEGVKLCRILEELSIWCIEGLSGGHMKYGKPGEEYVQGLKFCASLLLTQTEQARCYNHILPRLRIWYTKNKIQEICATVPQNHKALCPT